EKADKTLTGAGEVLIALRARLSDLKPFESAAIELACREIGDDLAGGKLGKVAMPLRAALTGTTVSPSIFHAAEILGQEETLARLEYAMGKFDGMSTKAAGGEVIQPEKS